MFVHNLLRCWVDTHQRSSQSLVQDRLRPSEAEPRFKSARNPPALGIRQGPRRSSRLLLPRGCRATGLLAASFPSCPELEAASPLCPSIRLRPSAASNTMRSREIRRRSSSWRGWVLEPSRTPAARLAYTPANAHDRASPSILSVFARRRRRDHECTKHKGFPPARTSDTEIIRLPDALIGVRWPTDNRHRMPCREAAFNVETFLATVNGGRSIS